MFNPENYTPFHDWHESVFDMAKEAAKIIGIDIDDIRYSGFWSQGDGASFTGSYAYVKGAAAAIRKEFPTATELHNIADRLADAQRRHFYQLRADISQSGRYVHEMTMKVDVERADGKELATGKYVHGRYQPPVAEESVTESMWDFARWIYATLESEYEYQSAWELASAWQERETEAKEEKAAARALIKDIRAVMRSGIAAAPSICSALRSTVRRHLAAMREALEDREAMADYFSYWHDGRRVDIAEFAAANL